MVDTVTAYWSVYVKFRTLTDSRREPLAILRALLKMDPDLRVRYTIVLVFRTGVSKPGRNPGLNIPGPFHYSLLRSKERLRLRRLLK